MLVPRILRAGHARRDLRGPAASGDAVAPPAEETRAVRVLLVVAAVLPRPAQPERARAEAGLADLEPVAAVQPHRGGGLPGLRALVPLAVHRPAVAAELGLDQHVVGPPREAVHDRRQVRRL